MSKLVLKIAKIIPRLDSEHVAEQLAAVSLIRKLLLQNVDDEHNPPRPAPLKFVDVSMLLLQFAEPEPEPEPEPAPAPAQPEPMQPIQTPHFSPVGASPNSPPPQPQAPVYTRSKPPCPAGAGWVWDVNNWVLTRPPLISAGWGSSARHWQWSPTLERWNLLPQPYTPPPPKPQKIEWHTVANRTIPEYEARCRILIDLRIFRTPKEKDFLESCYFRLSSNMSLTTSQLSWFHGISSRHPF